MSKQARFSKCAQVLGRKKGERNFVGEIYGVINKQSTSCLQQSGLGSGIRGAERCKKVAVSTALVACMT